MNGQKGFTLIELIMIIVILGILAAVAVPRYFNLTSDAQTAAERGVVGGVRSGIQTYYANYRAFPPALDSDANAACSNTNSCFTNVLSQGGITEDWIKNTGTTYEGPTGSTYTYSSATGNFQ